MVNIQLSKIGTTAFEKILGHNPAILSEWNVLDEVLYKTSGLDKNLLEQVRRTLAFENGCEYCMVKGGKPDYDESQQKISLATGFAELFCKDHQSITNQHFSMLREYFSDPEISALCVFIAFINASQKLGKTWNLTEDFQKNAVTRMEDLDVD